MADKWGWKLNSTYLSERVMSRPKTRILTLTLWKIGPRRFPVKDKCPDPRAATRNQMPNRRDCSGGQILAYRLTPPLLGFTLIGALLVRQVAGHTPAPEPIYLLVLYWVMFCLCTCRVLCGQLPVEVSSPQVGASHPGFMVSSTLYSGTNSLNSHWNAHYGQDKLQAIPSPRTTIYWYCIELCFVFVGFYVGNCLSKCPVL